MRRSVFFLVFYILSTLCGDEAATGCKAWQKPQGTSGHCAVIFSAANCTGTNFTVPHGDLDNLGKAGYNEAKIGSMVVGRGCTLRLSEHSKQRGTLVAYTSDSTEIDKGIKFAANESSTSCFCNYRYEEKEPIIPPRDDGLVCPPVMLGSSCAVAFDRENCTGRQLSLAHTHSISDLSTRRFDDAIKSFVVAENCELMMCTRKDFGAGCESYTNQSKRSVAHFLIFDDAFDRASSAKCFCDFQKLKCDDSANTAEILGDNCAVTFDLDNCAGRKIELPPSTFLKYLPAHDFNDAIKSFVVAENCELVLFQHAYWEGKHIIRKGTTERSLAHFDVGDDRTSSMSCTCDYDPSKMDVPEKKCTNEEQAKTSQLRENCAVVYSDEDCGGHMLIFNNNTKNEFLGQTKMINGNSWNDKIKSLIVNDGCELTMCPAANYGGDCDHIRNGSMRSVGPKRFENLVYDRASSIVCVCPKDLEPWDQRPSRCSNFEAAVDKGSSTCALTFKDQGCHGHSHGSIMETFMYKYKDGEHIHARSLIVKKGCELTMCYENECSPYTGYTDLIQERPHTNYSSLYCYCHDETTTVPTTTEAPVCEEGSYVLVGFLIFLLFAFGHVAWWFYTRRGNADGSFSNAQFIELH